METKVNYDERVRLANTAREPGFTLDGKAAMICGYMNDFATVWAFGDKRGAPIESTYSWETVKQIIDTGNRQFFTT